MMFNEPLLSFLGFRRSRYNAGYNVLGYNFFSNRGFLVLSGQRTGQARRGYNASYNTGYNSQGLKCQNPFAFRIKTGQSPGQKNGLERPQSHGFGVAPAHSSASYFGPPVGLLSLCLTQNRMLFSDNIPEIFQKFSDILPELSQEKS